MEYEGSDDAAADALVIAGMADCVIIDDCVIMEDCVIMDDSGNRPGGSDDSDARLA